jgi:hypothetical protein
MRFGGGAFGAFVLRREFGLAVLPALAGAEADLDLFGSTSARPLSGCGSARTLANRLRRRTFLL